MTDIIMAIDSVYISYKLSGSIKKAYQSSSIEKDVKFKRILKYVWRNGEYCLKLFQAMK